MIYEIHIIFVPSLLTHAGALEVLTDPALSTYLFYYKFKTILREHDKRTPWIYMTLSDHNYVVVCLILLLMNVHLCVLEDDRG